MFFSYIFALVRKAREGANNDRGEVVTLLIDDFICFHFDESIPLKCALKGDENERQLCV